MRIAGNYTFEATRAEVRAALNDPDVIKRSIPGCQKFDRVGEREFASELTVDVNSIHSVFSGRMRVEDVKPLESYRIVVYGDGDDGFVMGEGIIKLRDDVQTIIMDYGGEVQIGGTIARTSQPMLDGAAKVLINQTLRAISAQVIARRADHSIVFGGGGIDVVPGAASEPAGSSSPENPLLAQQEDLQPSSGMPAAGSSLSLDQFSADSAYTPEHHSDVERGGVAPRGVIADTVERFWLLWVLLAFIFGYLLGRRRRR